MLKLLITVHPCLYIKTEAPKASVICFQILVTVENGASDRVKTPRFLTRFLKTVDAVLLRTIVTSTGHPTHKSVVLYIYCYFKGFFKNLFKVYIHHMVIKDGQCRLGREIID